MCILSVITACSKIDITEPSLQAVTHTQQTAVRGSHNVVGKDPLNTVAVTTFYGAPDHTGSKTVTGFSDTLNLPGVNMYFQLVT